MFGSESTVLTVIMIFIAAVSYFIIYLVTRAAAKNGLKEAYNDVFRIDDASSDKPLHVANDHFDAQ